jgi:predicted DNA-binding transcriptional regulator YafY
LKPTEDFIGAILQQGDRLEIMAPEELRERVKERLKKALKPYMKK